MSLRRRRTFNVKINDDLDNSNIIDGQYLAKLINVKTDKQHILIPRKVGAILIGRSSSCDIRINGSDVSSKHCRLNVSTNEDGMCLYITDMSTNGTLLNEEIIGKFSSTLVKDGDTICFAKMGGTYLVKYFRDENQVRNGAVKRLGDDYVLGAHLGSGHYAVVKEARNRHSGATVAVKIFHPNRSSENNDSNSKFQQEINLLLSINHPNIIKFISHYVEPINKSSSTTYLVLEKVNNGELFQRIINKQKLRQDETKAIFKQILSGLEYLHSNNIIHRDIKPENILLDVRRRSSPDEVQTGPWDEDEFDLKVKIADFGLAKFIGELKFTNTLCGTPAYVAPEILSNQRSYSTKVDLWSSGVLLYVCLCGFPPFSDELAPPGMREQILQAKYAFYSPYWDDISDSALHLIASLLVVDAEERLDVIQTMRHFWFGEEDAVEQNNTMDESIQRIHVRADSQPMSLSEKYMSDIKWEEQNQS
ncbi:Piso0_000129 [Millerozyma farinosa CBS 7064]|uniref:Piso0_000129 protein n=1 Tax=Pichia sorbitophila (strain ATCC MYA-4447 / BCRC 22081 / CBS 7064 / NBRC 10061 / NRRL Y-12695) TaxID=559304 RepID=G8YT59_PICSO|nr:Piso0_000129 [Millerozyma farinosa CBS 7064]